MKKYPIVKVVSFVGTKFGIEKRFQSAELIYSERIELNVCGVEGICVDIQSIRISGDIYKRVVTRFMWKDIEGEPYYDTNKAIDSFAKLLRKEFPTIFKGKKIY